MPSRRRHASPPVSLFAFQDVMMAVMGILVIVTLLMALDMTFTVVDAAPRAKQEGDPAEPIDSAKLDRLRQQERELRTIYAEALARASNLATVTGDEGDDIKGKIAELNDLQGEVRELEEKIAEMRWRDVSSAKERENKQRVTEQILQMEQRANQLEAEANELARSSRLTYIIQEGVSKSPVIIEVSGTQIGIGSPQEPEAALWLDASGDAARMKLLFAFVSNYDPSSHYFVVILKPSGAEHFDPIMQELITRGFQTGTELIAESQSVLIAPKP